MSIERTNNKAHFSYSTLLQILEKWDVRARIAQKLPLPHLSPNWISLIQQSLVYYLLKSLPWAFLDFQTRLIIVHSYTMKQVYTQIAIKNNENFDLKCVVLVKTITYFVGSHFHEVLADATLQNDIYQLIIHNLIGMLAFILGIPIQPFAYRTLIKQFKSSATSKKERQSRDLDIIIDQSSEIENKVRSLQFHSRRHAKKPTADNLQEINEMHTNLEEIRSVLKQNLYVKPIIRPPTPKHSINKLRQLQSAPLDQNLPKHKQVFTQPTPKKDLQKAKRTVLSNQLSNAFEFNSTLKLKEVKRFQIQRSTAKLEPMRHSFNQSRKNSVFLKLEIKREESKSRVQTKSGQKSIKAWNQTITNMKNELYTGNYKNSNKNVRGTHNYDDQNFYLRIQARDGTHKNLKYRGRLEGGSSKDSIKFRKLDLMNSPNVLISEAPADNKEEQVMTLAAKNYSLFRVEMAPVNCQVQVNKVRQSRILNRKSSLFQLYQNDI